MSTIKHCDRCKEKIGEEDRAHSSFSFHSNFEILGLEKNWYNFDLCADCAVQTIPKVLNILKSE